MDAASSTSTVGSANVTSEAEIGISSIGRVNTENPGAGARGNEGEVSVGIDGVVVSLGWSSPPASPHFCVLSREFSIVDAELQGTHMRRVGEGPELRLAFLEVGREGRVEVRNGLGGDALGTIPKTSVGTILTDDLNSDGGVVTLLRGNREINTDFVLDITKSNGLGQSTSRVKIEKAVFATVLSPVRELSIVRIIEVVAKKAQVRSWNTDLVRKTYPIGSIGNANINRKVMVVGH